MSPNPPEIIVRGQCQTCGNMFEAIRHNPKGRRPRYCSDKCKGKMKRTVARRREAQEIYQARIQAGIVVLDKCFLCEKPFDGHVKNGPRIQFCPRCRKDMEEG